MEYPHLSNVIDAIGIEISSFFHPNDLFNLSLANHHISEGIRAKLIQVALRQLPKILDEQVECQVKVSKRHSFPNRERLLEQLLYKIEAAELKFAGKTKEQSLIDAKEVLNTEKKPGVYGATFISETSWGIPGPEYTHVGYNYQKDNLPLATVRCIDILERISCMQHAPLVKSWMKYLLVQKSLTIGSWFWTCRHRYLDFQGVEGKGIMFCNPESGEELELQYIVMTRIKVGEEEEVVGPIIPQFAVATRVDEAAPLNPFLACSPIEAEVVIDESDVYAVSYPYIVSPSEQGVAEIENGYAHTIPAEEESSISGNTVQIETHRRQQLRETRSFIGRLKTSASVRLKRIKRQCNHG